MEPSKFSKKFVAGPNILKSVKKEIDARKTREKELSYGDYYGCEWHDSGTGDCENN
ncbi:MAG: hypothetical protein ABIJ17_00730 [Patescibacteria group bacterium]